MRSSGIKSELESHIWLENLLDQCFFNLRLLLLFKLSFRRSRAGWGSAFFTHSRWYWFCRVGVGSTLSAAPFCKWLVTSWKAQWYGTVKWKQGVYILGLGTCQENSSDKTLLNWVRHYCTEASPFSITGYQIFLTSVKGYFFLNICVSVFQAVIKHAEFHLYPGPTEPPNPPPSAF